jgi:hypothetical protein
MGRKAELVPLLGLVLAAVAYTVGVIWRGSDPGYLRGSYDIYAAHYPSVVYALESLKLGQGLLWNPFQNCGQPFLPSTLVGLLYPLHALFLVLDVEAGFLVLAALHLALAGVFAFFLCREYGLGRTGAMCGGLAFMLGGSALALAVWLPTTILGPYVWIPASLYMTERILRAPSAWGAVGLGMSLTLGLLPGYPQISFFTYQLVLLRALWELGTNREARRPAVLAWLALGLGLPLVLAAPYLLPSIEFARESVRGRSLSLEEIAPYAKGDEWVRFRQSAGFWTNSFLPIFTLVPTAVAALACAERRTWRLAAFYLLCTALYMVLAFHGRAFTLYRGLPMGSAFREPMRFTWIVSFTVSVLVGIGADHVSRLATVSRPRVLFLGGVFLLGAYAFSLVCQRPFLRSEWLLFVLALAVIASLGVFRRSTVLVWVVLPVLVGANLFTQGTTPFMLRIEKSHELFSRHADAFEFLRGRMSAQDRMYQIAEHQDYSLTAKTASMARLPSIADYEPQTSLRFAELTMELLTDRPITSINAFNFRRNEVPRSWPLFDLLATRYMLFDARGNRFNLPLRPGLRELWTDGQLRILENPSALPRALWVPRLEVVPDAARVMARLKSPGHDPRQVALVEAPPADGFLGTPGGSGAVVSLEERAEVVELRVRAAQDGFVVLADQHYPGWEATVNGARTPIVRANYAFRVVRVPAGESHVVFRYRPRSVRYGAFASLGTLGVIGGFLVLHLATGFRRLRLRRLPVPGRLYPRCRPFHLVLGKQTAIVAVKP